MVYGSVSQNKNHCLADGECAYYFRTQSHREGVKKDQAN